MRSKKTDKQILEALQKCWNEKAGDSICDDCAYAKDEPVDLECLSWLHEDAANLLNEKEIDLAVYGGVVGIQGAPAKVNRLEDGNRALRTELATNKKPCTLYPANEQEAKADAGKPRLTLVPQRIIWDIAAVRDFGTKKYKDPNNWKRVSKERYRDAAFRHFMRYLATPHGVDEESGLPHLWHCCCNLAFLCELEGNNDG